MADEMTHGLGFCWCGTAHPRLSDLTSVYVIVAVREGTDEVIGITPGGGVYTIGRLMATENTQLQRPACN